MVIMSTNELSESDSMDNRFHHVNKDIRDSGIPNFYTNEVTWIDRISSE